MKDKDLESYSTNSTKFLQPQDAEGYSFYEPRQSGEQINLNFVLDSLRKYWYASILVSTLMMAGIGYKILTTPLIYKSEIQIAIDLKESASLAEKLAATVSGGAGFSDNQSMTIETTIQTLMSKTIVQEALDSIPDGELRPSIGSTLSNLKMTSKKNSSIIFITYTDTSPQRVVATLSALSKVYTNYSIKTKKASIDKSIAFIDSQLPESRNRLAIAAQDVEKFRQKYRFFDPESSSKNLAQYRQEIVVKLNEAKVQYDQAQKQFEELKQQMTAVGLKSDNILSVTVLTQDGAYQDLFKKLNELDLAYNQERLRFNNDNPLVIAAKGKRDQMLLLLKDRARQVLKREVSATELTSGGGGGLATNIANKRFELAITLVSQIAQYQSSYKIYQQVETQLAQLPTLQKEYAELQRQYGIYSQELTAFLQKLQELKLADAEQVAPWRLLDPPDLPEAPVPPTVPSKMGFGLLVSLLAGVLTALGLKKLDRRIDNPDTVKTMVGMPILAMIPKVESLDQVSMQKGRLLQLAKSQITKSKITRNEGDDNAYWSFIEAIRTLALGIRLTADRQENQAGKVIALTSALPKEGKSTITFHTSIALAELGYRVLLVDVDLHKSTISKMCLSSELFLSEDLDSMAGLSNALLESDRWEDLIKKSLKFKLDVLFSGSQSINSITLLNSPRFIRLIEEWKKEYDYVIFDTPPIVGVSDTRLIATLVDGIVYVVGLNIAQRQMIDQAVDIIAAIKTPVLGLAINRVDNHYSGYHKYYQYYQKPSGLPEESTSIQILKGSPQEIEL